MLDRRGFGNLQRIFGEQIEHRIGRRSLTRAPRLIDERFDASVERRHFLLGMPGGFLDAQIP